MRFRPFFAARYYSNVFGSKGHVKNDLRYRGSRSEDDTNEAILINTLTNDGNAFLRESSSNHCERKIELS